MSLLSGFINSLAPTRLTELSDTPNSLTASKYLKVNSGGTAFEFVDITDPLLFKGGIAANSDFPTSAAVQTGWFYRVTADVTDDDPTKTNTGQSFLAGDEIAWNGTDWTSLGSTNPLTTLGDLIYGAASGVQTRLAGNTTTTQKFLTQTGDGANSAAPSWTSDVAADRLSMNKVETQNITAATDTIVISSAHINLNPDADYVLTSTPTITAPTTGQILILHNTSATYTIEIQDDGVLSGSDVLLAGASGIIAPGEVMILYYDLDEASWHVISHPNTPVGVPSNLSSIPVRNTSGSPMTIATPVYITGWNVGQGRVEIGLADANAAGENPAIGLTSGAIGNNGNGTVIVSGILTGVNTSSWSVNDALYVSETAGDLTNVRPTGASSAIQAVARVSRSATDGVIQVIGAGRANDVPNLTENYIWVGNSSNVATETDAAGIKTLLSLNNVENTAISTWAGSANIVTVGTIGTGTWQGTAIGAQYGGTGQNTSGSTGVPQINAGTWSVSTALANGTTATTQSQEDDSTKVATTEYVDALKRVVGIQVFASDGDTAVGDGAAFFRIPATLNGYNLVAVAANVYTAGTTGTTDVQIRNATDSHDMLSTKLTIDSGETDSSTAATPAVINATYDDVATGDKIAIDIDAVSTTAAQGLYVEMTFQRP